MYECQHCRARHPSIFLLFLHIFTNHIHADIGLDNAESKGLMDTVTHLKEVNVWPN